MTTYVEECIEEILKLDDSLESSKIYESYEFSFDDSGVWEISMFEDFETLEKAINIGMDYLTFSSVALYRGDMIVIGLRDIMKDATLELVAKRACIGEQSCENLFNKYRK